MRMPRVSGGQGEVVAVARDERVRLQVQVDPADSRFVELDEQGVGDTVAGPVERRLLRQAALDDPTLLFVRWLEDTAGSELVQHLVEVAGRHRSNERDMTRKVRDDPESLPLVRTAIVIEILLDELEPLGDASRHRRLNPISVPLELVDDESRDE
jgi:hypothetical protein